MEIRRTLRCVAALTIAFCAGLVLAQSPHALPQSESLLAPVAGIPDSYDWSQLQRYYWSRHRQHGPVSDLAATTDLPTTADAGISWINEIPWDGSQVVQAQFAAAPNQPVDPTTTLGAGLSSKPSKASFKSELRSLFGDTGGGGATSPVPTPPAATPAPAVSPAPVVPGPSQQPGIADPALVQPAPVTTQPAPAVQPVAPAAPIAPAVTPAIADTGFAETATAATIRATPPPLLSTPAVEVVATPEIQVLGSSETAEILQESSSVQTVEVQRRSPIDFDPRIRGFRSGQVYTQSDGALWFPARQDLDSIMSKLDPSLIQDAIVVPGPYGLRYGPGFGFVNIVTTPTPRYEDSPEVHARTGLTVRENGGQVYGRETVYGGGSDWGFIFNYGNRTGSDYDAGNGALIPASYHAQNFLGQLGFDIGDESHLEFRYQRLDQTDTEYAGQFFDLDLLVTDGFNLTYVNEQSDRCWDRLVFDTWYNRTRFLGDTLNQSKRNFHVIDRVEAALGLPTTGNPPSFQGTTNGAVTSLGSRTEAVFGEDDGKQLRIGSDVRILSQGLNENFDVIGNPSFSTNLPRSRMIDPGLYAEYTFLPDEYWSTTAGARVDWVTTTAREGDIRSDTSLPLIDSSRDQSDVLYSFYLVNDVKLLDNWSTRFGFGHSQRAPTLVERYSDGMFLGIIQSGFSRVIGDPNLDKERLWQLDASTRFRLRTGISG